LGNFYYELVQELRNDNFFITAETLERQSRFMKDFFSRFKSSFHYTQNFPKNYRVFLKKLLSFDPYYYYHLLSDYKGINQSLPSDKKSEEQLLQLQKSFYGFKLMLLYSFIVSIDLPLLLLAFGDQPVRNPWSIAYESKLRTLFENKCLPFLDYIDDEKAHFLKEYFKDTAINAHLPDDPGVEQPQQKESLLQKIIKLLPTKYFAVEFGLALGFSCLSLIILKQVLAISN
jgi:hypothetical protein